MLRPLVLSLMVSAVAVPAMAQDIKPEVEKIGAAYTDCVAKHDGACVASLYSKDGIQVNVIGEVKTDLKDRAWAWVHAPREAPPFEGDSPLYFMLENGLPALREVARLLVRESEPR